MQLPIKTFTHLKRYWRHFISEVFFCFELFILLVHQHKINFFNSLYHFNDL